MAGISDLSQDLFYEICFYLDACDLVALSIVCIKFSFYLNCQLYWKLRSQKFCKAFYPCINGKCIDWKEVQLDREKCIARFGSNNSTCFRNSYPYVVNQGIDTEYPNMLLVGDRGRVLSIFSFKNFLNVGTWIPVSTELRSHSGWIWTVNSCGDTVITGSWDGGLRVWSLTQSGLVFRSIYQLGTPILCSSFINPNLLAVGTHCGDVYLVDLRSSIEHTIQIRLRHKKSVLCMESIFELGLRSHTPKPIQPNSSRDLSMMMPWGDQATWDCSSRSELSSIAASEECLDSIGHDPFNLELDGVESVLEPDLNPNDKPLSNIDLLTGSRDQFLAGWDLRTISKPVLKVKLTCYPRKMSLLDRNELWVAEPPNRIHVFDIRNNQFHCAYTNSLTGWTRGFGGLKVTLGSLFACGLDGVVEVFHPTCPLIPLSNKPLEQNIHALPTSLEYYGGLLVVGSGNGSLHVWSSIEKLKSFDEY